LSGPGSDLVPPGSKDGPQAASSGEGALLLLEPMTKFLDPSFSVPAPGTDAYRTGWERTFGKKPPPPLPEQPPITTPNPPKTNNTHTGT
jgi:hypothetical protein